VQENLYIAPPVVVFWQFWGIMINLWSSLWMIIDASGLGLFLMGGLKTSLTCESHNM